MKYLAVDYGKKKIGLAISNFEETVAMPFGIIKNNEDFKEEFIKIVLKSHVEEIVIGQSFDLSGKENSIQKDIELFGNFVKEIGLKVHFVNEVFTSMEAKWGTEKEIRRSEKKSKKKQKNILIDDKAASMILRTFLEKKNN